MKKILRYLPLFLACLLLTACAEEFGTHTTGHLVSPSSVRSLTLPSSQGDEYNNPCLFVEGNNLYFVSAANVLYRVNTATFKIETLQTLSASAIDSRTKHCYFKGKCYFFKSSGSVDGNGVLITYDPSTNRVESSVADNIYCESIWSTSEGIWAANLYEIFKFDLQNKTWHLQGSMENGGDWAVNYFTRPNVSCETSELIYAQSIGFDHKTAVHIYMLQAPYTKYAEDRTVKMPPLGDYGIDKKSWSGKSQYLDGEAYVAVPGGWAVSDKAALHWHIYTVNADDSLMDYGWPVAKMGNKLYLVNKDKLYEITF